MKAELSDIIVAEGPSIFPEKFFIECGDGWFNLVLECVRTLDSLGLKNNKVRQIKQKFGGLRFYMDNDRESRDVEWAIRRAEDRASRECETCGAPGIKVSPNGWMRVTCGVHV